MMILIIAFLLACYFPRFRKFLFGQQDELVSAPFLTTLGHV